MSNHRLIICDRDEGYAKSLLNKLQACNSVLKNLELTCVYDYKQINVDSYDLFFLGADTFDESLLTLVKNIDQFSKKVILFTSQPSKNYINFATKTPLSNIYHKNITIDCYELMFLLKIFLNPNDYTFGVSNFLDSDASIKKYTVEHYELLSELQFLFEKFINSISLKNREKLMVVFLEATSNAISYSLIKNNDKSSDLPHLQSPINNKKRFIECQFGFDKDKIAISVLDNAGKLSKKNFLYWLNRNICEMSNYDTHGRGFYLMYKIVDRLIINIKPHCVTEIVFLLNRNQQEDTHKPLIINLF